MNNLERYDLCTLNRELIVFVGYSKNPTRPIFEILSSTHGVTDNINNLINIENYKPLHLGNWWGYEGLEKEIKLLSKRKGKRPSKKTINHFINLINK